MSKKHQNLSFFWPFCHFWGGILSFWKWKKSQKIWQNSRKSPINFFFENCTKSVKIYPNTPNFAFFYPLLLKKKFSYSWNFDFVFFFKDRNVLNLYLHALRGGVFECSFRFFLNFDVHFLENRFPNLFQKTTRVF